jgi:hypothetical protein
MGQNLALLSAQQALSLEHHAITFPLVTHLISRCGKNYYYDVAIIIFSTVKEAALFLPLSICHAHTSFFITLDTPVHFSFRQKILLLYTFLRTTGRAKNII